jgi:hypothetical protein
MALALTLLVSLLLWWLLLSAIICLASDGETLQMPGAVYVAWDNATGATLGYEYHIAEQGCHGGGWGLTRGTTQRPRALIGELLGLPGKRWPLYFQVRSLGDDNKTSGWVARTIQR